MEIITLLCTVVTVTITVCEQAFMQDFFFAVGEKDVEFRVMPPRGSGNVPSPSPRNFRCSEVASGGPKGRKLATDKVLSIKKKNQL